MCDLREKSSSSIFLFCPFLLTVFREPETSVVAWNRDRAMNIIVISSNTVSIRSISLTRKRRDSLPPLHHLHFANKKFTHAAKIRYFSMCKCGKCGERNLKHTHLSLPVSLLIANLHDGHGPPVKNSSSLNWFKLPLLRIFSENNYRVKYYNIISL